MSRMRRFRGPQSRPVEAMKACAAGIVLAGMVFGGMSRSGGCRVEMPPDRMGSSTRKAKPPSMKRDIGADDIRRRLAMDVHSSGRGLRSRLGADLSDPVLVTIQIEVDAEGRPSILSAEARCGRGACPSEVDIVRTCGLDLSGLRMAGPIEDRPFKVMVALTK